MSDPNWPPPAPPEYFTGSPPRPDMGELAGWGARAGGFLVDTLIVVVFAVVLALVVAAGGATEAETVVVLIAVISAYLYPALFMMRQGERNGQTLGKQAVGIRVVRESGQPMTFGWGLLRDLVCKGVLGLFTIPLLVSYLWPLWDERNQTIHDKMASTLVTRA